MSKLKQRKNFNIAAVVFFSSLSVFMFSASPRIVNVIRFLCVILNLAIL